MSEGKSQLDGLKSVMKKLEKKSCRKGATEEDVANYLAACFSFSSGNASRPDLPTNATISEYKGWKNAYDKTTDGTIIDFHVSCNS